MNTFENIFEAVHQETRKSSKKTATVKRVAESRRRLNEDLYDDMHAIKDEFGDIDTVRDELGIESPEDEQIRLNLGQKVADMLNARINNEMGIDNPGFECEDVYKDDDWVTVEVVDGDGFMENGATDSSGKDETQVIKEIVDSIFTNLDDGEYKGSIKQEKSKKEIIKNDELDTSEEGYIPNEDENEPEFEPIDEDSLAGCDLLTVEDFEEYKDNIPAIDMDWWLQDAAEGATENVQYVDENNEVVETGKGIYDYLGVRPYVVGEFEVGDEFSFNDYDWVAFSEDKAICTGVLGTMDFDTMSNKYDRSLIRDFIHDWAGGYDISEYEEEEDDEETDIEDDYDVEGEDDEMLIESNDDWVYGYKLTW